MVRSLSISRRDAVSLSLGAVLCPLIGACDDDRTVPTAPGDTEAAATITAAYVDIDTAAVTALRDPDNPIRAVVFFAARLIVVRQSADDFVALSNICPHAGCGVTIVRETGVQCPCHGSAFDLSGARIAGPAPIGLSRLTATFDQGTRRLRVMRPA